MMPRTTVRTPRSPRVTRAKSQLDVAIFTLTKRRLIRALTYVAIISEGALFVLQTLPFQGVEAVQQAGILIAPAVNSFLIFMFGINFGSILGINTAPH